LEKAGYNPHKKRMRNLHTLTDEKSPVSGKSVDLALLEEIR
jgi:hypothetical protein